MAYKDILVVLDADSATRQRIETAAALAARFEAHLVGLYVTLMADSEPASPLFYPPLYDPIWRDVQETSAARAEQVRQTFEDVTSRSAVSAEWRSAAGYPGDVAVSHARYADLVVLGQLDPEDPRGPLLRPRPEEVAMLAGRPILVIPYAGRFEEIGRRALVGWDASREAARAIGDALPLLTQAKSVTIMSVDAEKTRDQGETTAADLALHLARHGVAAQVERTVSDGIGVGNTLLSRASDLEADLLVMGAYGHSRIRELLLGGATRTVLASMTLPVLMAH